MKLITKCSDTLEITLSTSILEVNHFYDQHNTKVLNKTTNMKKNICSFIKYINIYLTRHIQMLHPGHYLVSAEYDDDKMEIRMFEYFNDCI